MSVPVTSQQMAKLEPYLVGSVPDDRGEIEMYCPMHDDRKRSAQLNVKLGVWYCHAGCGGGSVRQLMDAEESWVPPDGRVVAGSPMAPPRVRKLTPIDPTQMAVWHRRLMRSRRGLARLYELRGIDPHTARRAGLGMSERLFKIPVYNGDRDLVNIRTYDPDTPEHRRKIWSVRGHGQDRLYPISQLNRSQADGAPIIVCEGEWDALLTLQAGHRAITRTGSATSWKPEWGDLFNGLLVFVCQDCDRSGVEGAAKIGRNLSSAGAEVRYMRLPYPIKAKHGKDLTDYLLANDHDPSRALAWLKKGATTTPPEE